MNRNYKIIILLICALVALQTGYGQQGCSSCVSTPGEVELSVSVNSPARGDTFSLDGMRLVATEEDSSTSQPLMLEVNTVPGVTHIAQFRFSGRRPSIPWQPFTLSVNSNCGGDVSLDYGVVVTGLEEVEYDNAGLGLIGQIPDYPGGNSAVHITVIRKDEDPTSSPASLGSPGTSSGGGSSGGGAPVLNAPQVTQVIGLGSSPSGSNNTEAFHGSLSFTRRPTDVTPLDVSTLNLISVAGFGEPGFLTETISSDDNVRQLLGLDRVVLIEKRPDGKLLASIYNTSDLTNQNSEGIYLPGNTTPINQFEYNLVSEIIPELSTIDPVPGIEIKKRENGLVTEHKILLSDIESSTGDTGGVTCTVDLLAGVMSCEENIITGTTWLKSAREYILQASGDPVLKDFYTETRDISAGRDRLIERVVHGDTAGSASLSARTTYSYHPDSAEVNAGAPQTSPRLGVIKSILNPDGSWVYYDYADKDGIRFGERRIYRPWGHEFVNLEDVDFSQEGNYSVAISERENEGTFDYDLIETRYPNGKIVSAPLRSEEDGRSFEGRSVNESSQIDSASYATYSARYESSDHFSSNKSAYRYVRTVAPNGDVTQVGRAATYSDYNASDFPLSGAANFSGGADVLSSIRYQGISFDGVSFPTSFNDLGDLSLIEQRSTRRYTFYDEDRRTVLVQDFVYLNGGWQLTRTGATAYDFIGRVLTRWENGAIEEEYVYEDFLTEPSGFNVGTSRVTRTDSEGVVTETVRVADGRVIQRTTKGVNSSGDLAAQLDLVETIQYSNQPTTGYLVEITTRAGGTVSVQSQEVKDLRGRIISRTDENGTSTYSRYPVLTVGTNSYSGLTRETYASDNSTLRESVRRSQTGDTVYTVSGVGRVEQVEFADGLTSIDYNGVNTPVELRTIRLGTAGSFTAWTKEYYSMDNQLLLTESPPIAGNTGNRQTWNYYDAAGRLIKQTVAGQSAARLWEYDGFGAVFREGLDVDGDGQLTPASNDRIQENRSGMVSNSGQVWSNTESYVYVQNGSDVAELSNENARLLYDASGAYSGGFMSSQGGQAYTSLETVNRATKIKSVAQQQVGVAQNQAVSTYYNGLLVSQTTQSVTTPIIYKYDGLKRNVSAVDPRTSNEQITAYQANSNLTASVTDLANGVTEYGYYSASHVNAGQVKYTENTDNKRSYYAYDIEGKVTHQWGAAQYPRKTSYHPVSGQIQYLHTYRADNGWNTETLPAGFASEGDKTTWNYDPVSFVLNNKRYADDTGIDYTYDASGRVQTRAWSTSRVTTYAYNGATGDLTGTTYSSANTAANIFSQHDRLGRPHQVTDITGTRTLAYDGVTTNLSNESWNASSGEFSEFEIDYSRSNGRIDGFTLSHQNTQHHENAFQYDSATGRLDKVIKQGHSYSYEYHPSSDLIHRVTAKAGTTAIFKREQTYDTANRLNSISSTAYPSGIAGVLDSHTYRYNDAGLRDKDTLASGSFWIYEYNDRGELIDGRKHRSGVDEAANRWLNHSFEYDYDAIGNRKRMRTGGDASGSGLATTTYTANNLNQYSAISSPSQIAVYGSAPAGQSVTVNGQATSRQGDFFSTNLTAANSAGPVYQDIDVTMGSDTVSGSRYVPQANVSPVYQDGNLVNDGRWVYTWNDENRLISVTSTQQAVSAGAPWKRVSYGYDYLGKRVLRTEESKIDGSTTEVSRKSYFYEGWNCIAEFDVSVDRSSLTMRRAYIWGLDLSGSLQGAGGVGGLLSVSEQDGNTYFAGYDGNGNITTMANNEGLEKAAYEYDPFGNVIRQGGEYAGTNKWRFSTKSSDSTTGLYYYGYRWYDAYLGRWPSRDPIEENGGVNLYAFVENDAVNHSDYLGLAKIWVVERQGPKDDFYKSDHGNAGFLWTRMWRLSASGTAFATHASAVAKVEVSRFGSDSEFEYATVSFKCNQDTGDIEEASKRSGGSTSKNGLSAAASISATLSGKEATVEFTSGAAFQSSLTVSGSIGAKGAQVSVSSVPGGGGKAGKGTAKYKCVCKEL